MANRNTLAVSKLEDFKQWLISDDWKIVDTKGYFEVLRAVKEKILSLFTKGYKQIVEKNLFIVPF